MKESDFEEIMRVQRMMASRIVEEQQQDNKIKLMMLVNDLVSGPKQVVQKEALIIEAQLEGMTEKQVEALLPELERDNFIVIQGAYVKKI